MILGIVKIRTFKDGTQSGSYTSLNTRQILEETPDFFSTSFSKLMREKVAAKKYPEEAEG